MDFERAMVNMGGLILIKEKTVMIDGVGATVNMREEGDILSRAIFLWLNPEKIGRHDVKILGVEFN